MSRDIDSQQNRNRVYINNLIITEIKQTQSEIMDIFEIYLNHSLSLTDCKNDLLKVTKDDDLQYIDYIGVVTINNEIEYYTIYQKGYTPDFKLSDILKKRLLNRSKESIYGEVDYGYLTFPLTTKDYEINKYLVIMFSIERFVQDKFKILTNALAEEGYILSIVDGKDFFVDDVDFIYDLNDIFSIEKRRDYLSRIKLIHINKELILKSKNRYLTIKHSSGAISNEFYIKKVIYFSGVTIVYLLIISLILYIHLAHINLKRSIQREQEFTALISHELKTPLSSILLGGDNLQSGVVHDLSDVKSYGLLIVKEASKLKKMIEGILRISTLNKNDILLQHESCRDIVEEVLNNLSKIIVDNRVNIRKNFLDVDVKLSCHRVSLISCLQNIVENGVIYGSSKSQDHFLDITIKEMKKGIKPGIAFIVQDYGPGIPFKDHKNIFNNYYRAERSIKEQIPGSGMGLSISRKIIEKFNGSVTLYSSIKKGATFELWLPK
ncbi:MAG: hypothetical protein B6229_04375 [Spirochaetaceae bacterium 4572_7]|nr:MAG: hypothetical protein B6229_04375 [Spirochaetaceae bacterium 4572_7]